MREGNVERSPRLHLAFVQVRLSLTASIPFSNWTFPLSKFSYYSFKNDS